MSDPIKESVFAALRAKVASGWTVSAIARDFGRSRPTIYGWLRDAGIEPPGKAGSGRAAAYCPCCRQAIPAERLRELSGAHGGDAAGADGADSSRD